MTTFPQTAVWVCPVHVSVVHRQFVLTLYQGGQAMYPNLVFSELRNAIADFSVNSQDPKAAILPSYISYEGVPFVAQGFFYDGPTPPPGTFSGFDDIFTLYSDLKTRSYLDLILSAPANSSGYLR